MMLVLPPPQQGTLSKPAGWHPKLRPLMQRECSSMINAEVFVAGPEGDGAFQLCVAMRFSP